MKYRSSLGAQQVQDPVLSFAVALVTAVVQVLSLAWELHATSMLLPFSRPPQKNKNKISIMGFLYLKFKYFLFFNIKASESLINFCNYQKKKAKAINVHYPDQLGAKIRAKMGLLLSGCPYMNLQDQLAYDFLLQSLFAFFPVSSLCYPPVPFISES